MKSKLTVFLLLTLIMLAAVPLSAAEREGRNGIGFRGSLFAPLYEGDDFSRFENKYEPFMLGWGIGVNFSHHFTRRFALNLSLDYASTYDDSTASSDQSFKFLSSDDASAKIDGIIIGVTGSYFFFPESKFQPYLLGGFGFDLWWLNDRLIDDTYRANDFTFKIGAGLEVWVTERFTVDLQGVFTYDVHNLYNNMPDDFYGVYDWTEPEDRPFIVHFQPSIGITYYFGGGVDTDKDGVNDKKDQCPDTPLGAHVDKAGCPLDSDADGVYNGLDTCANTPVGAKVDKFGCPLDTDMDGVFDGLDKCPETPEAVPVDADGCPFDTDKDGVPDYKDREPDTPLGAVVDEYGVAIDSDKDGVPDGLDKCPDTPAGAAIDPFGCPYDADQDGVADSLDKCLGTPAGIKVDETGCPIVKRIEEKITLSNKIAFASGSFELLEGGKVVLDEIAESMRAYPDTRIKISGFADATGPADFNLELSQKRADAVKAYIVNKGVDAERMTSVGYGEDPQYFIGDNDTSEGRLMNRRVEIESIK
ncbi:MAG: OmpA family protein [candidate division Zixibacteria bacterium]|nr:OmpA family protein [candidate division Zixibacteria bacterium]